ncbi:MAG TPA: glycosyltransferase family 39 protein [Candidatus Baltobacteraceae bacterium]|nr:glycosyltransferase family 39 protein [Candidatus Baltobacteraceae bacterium]
MNAARVPVIAALVTLVVHLAGNPHYGFFRDELYFIICGFHPAWGYVDQPPVAPLLAAGSQLFGHSLFLLRAVPAIFAAAGAYVTCKIVLELGGDAFAEVVAAIAYLFCNVLLSFGTKVGPDMVGLWLWPLAALYVLRIAKGGDPRLWLAAGAAIGVSLQSKYSVVFFAAALVAGLLLTSQRRILFSRWCLAGAALAAAIALPNVIWQAVHGFPMLELLRNGQNGKNVIASPGLYLVQQLLLTNLFLAPIWIVGLVWLFRDRVARFLAWTYVVLIALMIVAHGKHYYPGNVYPIVIAAGGVAIERWTKNVTLVRVALVPVTIVAGLFFLPFSLPVLGEAQMVDYQQWVGDVLHISRSTMATEHSQTAALPTDWADMHGWPELVATIAGVYNALPPDERRQAAIVASNYGEAGAIDFFGKQYGLPPALSGHNNYWLWGTHGYSGNVIVDVHGDCGAKEHLFASSRRAAVFDAPWVISYEHEVPIMVCRGLRVPLATLWPQLKEYI